MCPRHTHILHTFEDSDIATSDVVPSQNDPTVSITLNMKIIPSIAHISYYEPVVTAHVRVDVPTRKKESGRGDPEDQGGRTRSLDCDRTARV